jgi:hypothetical protein
MHSISIYTYVVIGLHLRHIHATEHDEIPSDVLEAIGKLRARLDETEFVVSLSGMYLFEEVEVKIRDLGEAPYIGADIANQVRDVAMQLERIVFSEATTRSAYILPQRRFNSQYLLTCPEQLLRSGSFEKLSTIAQFDLASAGRCLLFGESTAAAFHILRATEDTLKAYYFYHRRKDRLIRPMWAQMITQLRAKKTNKPSQVLLDSLDLVRNSYRNPTQHPEAIYDIDQAQDLFGVCLDLISKMTAELTKKLK